MRRLFECDTCMLTSTITYEEEDVPPEDHPCETEKCGGIRRVIGGHGVSLDFKRFFQQSSVLSIELDATKAALKANQLALRAAIASAGGSVTIPRDSWGEPPSNLYMTQDFDTNAVILAVD
jgi:hypothetical protein